MAGENLPQHIKDVFKVGAGIMDPATYAMNYPDMPLKLHTAGGKSIAIDKEGVIDQVRMFQHQAAIGQAASIAARKKVNIEDSYPGMPWIRAQRVATISTTADSGEVTFRADNHYIMIYAISIGERTADACEIANESDISMQVRVGDWRIADQEVRIDRWVDKIGTERQTVLPAPIYLLPQEELNITLHNDTGSDLVTPVIQILGQVIAGATCPKSKRGGSWPGCPRIELVNMGAIATTATATVAFETEFLYQIHEIVAVNTTAGDLLDLTITGPGWYTSPVHYESICSRDGNRDRFNPGIIELLSQESLNFTVTNGEGDTQSPDFLLLGCRL
jgi:hypothetical protein